MKKTVKDTLTYFKVIDEKLHCYFTQSGNPILVNFENQLSIITPPTKIGEVKKTRKPRSQSSRKPRTRKLENIEGVIKPSSPFFMFMAEERIKLRESNPTIANKDIIRIAGQKWIALKSDKKDHYCRKHEEIKANYNKYKKIREENKEQDSFLSSIVNQKLSINDSSQTSSLLNQFNQQNLM